MKNLFIIIAFGFLLGLSIKQEKKIADLQRSYSELSVQLQEQALLDQIGKQLITTKLNLRDFNQ